MIADRYIRRTVEAVALLSPFMGTVIAGFPISIIDFMLPLFLLILFTGGIAASPVAGFYLAYIAVCLVSPLFQAGDIGLGDIARSMIAAMRQVSIFAPFFLVFCIKDLDEAYIQRIIRLAVIGLFISVAAGLFMHYAGISVRDSQQFWERSLGRYSASSRAGGLSGNTGAYGLTIVAFAMALFVAMPATDQKVSRPFAWISAGMIVLATVLSSSRGGMLQLLLMVAPLVILGRIKIGPTPVLALGLAISGGVLLVSLSGGALPISFDSVIFQRLDIFNLSGSSQFLDSARASLFARAIDSLPDYWMFGVGYKRQIEALQMVVDNSFLLVLLETGAFALIFFSLFWLFLLYRIVTLMRRERILSVVVLFIYLSVIARMMISAVHTNWSSMPVIYLLMALLLRASALRADRLAAQRRGAAPTAGASARAPDGGPAPLGAA
ncbi:hypothetical protein SAMN05444336_102135 [Albimonas donghaensis]|uniref:O-antigen ligase n=1 Tax=Albimonas donghaensis TaxID=356660 RepID=A0A1H2VPN5_9RHOB|nr:hypothetical protein [Albimonas donghaensis]SDW70250.1 hypothetical protein SAMN05444336_102135 [Albimonas donghaensis]